MAREGSGSHRRPVGDIGARVQITVVPGPRGPTPWDRIAPPRKRRVGGCLVAATVAAGALLAAVSLSSRRPTIPPLPTTVLPNTVLYPTYLRATGPVAVPRVYADPFRCLSLLIAMHDPNLRNGAFDENLPCGRPRGPYTMIAIWAGQSRATRGEHRH